MTGPSVDYEFARGVARRAETWTVDELGVTTNEGRTVAWSQLTELTFSDAPGGRFQVSELVLMVGDERIKVQCNAKRRSPSRSAFLGMCRDIAQRLDRTRPDIRFMPATGFSIATWVFAALGLGIMIFGLYYIGVAVSDWSASGSGFALGMGIGAVLLGLFSIWCASPWQKVPPKTPAESVAWIDRIVELG